MRIFLTILAISAYIAHAMDVDNKHYSQHRTSVDTAKQSMQERLSKLEQQNAYQRQYGANENYVAGCTSGCSTGSSSAYSSRSSSSSSSQRSSSTNALDNSDYVGVGILSHNSYGNDDSDLQQRISSRYSSSGSAHEADDLQQRQVPGDLSNVQAAAYRQSSASRHSTASRSGYREEEDEEEEDNLQKTVGAGYHDLAVNNDRYAETQSQRRTQQFQKESESRVTSGGRPVYIVPGGASSTSYRSSASNSESQLSESRTQRPVSVGQYVSMSVRPGTSTVLTIPVSAQDQSQQRVYASSNRRDYQAGSESSRTRVQPGYQINHYPSYSSDRTASSTASRGEAVTTRTNYQSQPDRITSTDTRYNRKESEEEEEEEDTQQRISPVNSGGSRYSSTSGGSLNYQQGYTSSRVVPVVPVHTVESTSSQRTAEEQRQGFTSSRVVPVVPVHTVESASSQRTAEEQRRYLQARPVYSQRTSSNRNDNEQASSSSQQTTVNRPVYTSSRSSDADGSQYGSSGTTYYTVPTQTRTQLQAHNQQGSSQTQYQAGSAAQTQYQAANAAQAQHQAGSGTRVSYGGYQVYPTYTRTGGSTAQRGSTAGSAQQRFNSQSISTNSDDLVNYMSESERLARVQQNQIASSQSSALAASAAEANRRTVNTASNLDAAAAGFVSSNNLANRFNEYDNVESLGGTGGFKRVKSWQKQSKWASGSEYGTDGQPKSYSMLSTAEAEKHNINGAETGYKAATTTLENDGKVSTYSIHTP